MEKRLGISGRIAAGFQRNAIPPLLALVLMDHVLLHRAQNADVHVDTPILHMDAGE